MYKYIIFTVVSQFNAASNITFVKGGEEEGGRRGKPISFARNFHIGFDPDYEVIKTPDLLLTRFQTIGSFSLLFISNEKTKMSSFVVVLCRTTARL